MPTRLRTVEELVNTHRVELALLDRLAHRRGAAGAARTVRYAVASSTSQPSSMQAGHQDVRGDVGSRQEDAVDRVELPGRTRASPPGVRAPDCSPAGTRSGLIQAHDRSASAVTPPTAATFSPANARAVETDAPRTAPAPRFTAFTEVNPTHSYRPVTIPVDRLVHLRRGCAAARR
jgi:hypothetical protein